MTESHGHHANPLNSYVNLILRVQASSLQSNSVLICGEVHSGPATTNRNPQSLQNSMSLRFLSPNRNGIAAVAMVRAVMKTTTLTKAA